MQQIPVFRLLNARSFMFDRNETKAIVEGEAEL